VLVAHPPQLVEPEIVPLTLKEAQHLLEVRTNVGMAFDSPLRSPWVYVRAKPLA
jgi:hypothetical protein